MASKENLYQIGKNLGSLAAVGAALYGGIVYMERGSQSQSQSQSVEVGGQMLTAEEIAQMRNYDKFMAVVSKIEPTATPMATATSIPNLTIEPKPQKMEMMSVVPTTAEQAKLIERYKAELPSILVKVNADFQQIADLTIYYPIYRAGQDRYGVPWELIWIIHQEESNVSRNKAAFESSIHYGAMQRAVQFHTLEDRDRANLGLEYLQALAVRHFDDVPEIMLADAEIAEWAGKDKNYDLALHKYSAPGPAKDRFQKFLALEALLKQ